jgi:hypothetical protein
LFGSSGHVGFPILKTSLFINTKYYAMCGSNDGHDSGANLDLSEGTHSEKFTGGDLNSSSQNLGLATDLASQVLYRVCELSLSKNLSKSEAIDLYLSSLQAVIEIVNPPKTDAPDIQKSIEN